MGAKLWGQGSVMALVKNPISYCSFSLWNIPFCKHLSRQWFQRILVAFYCYLLLSLSLLFICLARYLYMVTRHASCHCLLVSLQERITSFFFRFNSKNIENGHSNGCNSNSKHVLHVCVLVDHDQRGCVFVLFYKILRISLYFLYHTA